MTGVNVLVILSVYEGSQGLVVMTYQPTLTFTPLPLGGNGFVITDVIYHTIKLC